MYYYYWKLGLIFKHQISVISTFDCNFTTLYSLQYGVIEVRVGAAEDKVGDLVPVGHCPSAVFTTSIHQGSLAGNISLLGSHSHTSAWRWNLMEGSESCCGVLSARKCTLHNNSIVMSQCCHVMTALWHDGAVVMQCTKFNLTVLENS